MAGGRRIGLATLAGQKVDDVPGKSDPLLLPLPLETLHCTRFNPRRNFGTDEELKEFGHKLDKEQLQPAVAVSRAGYLKLWPDEAENVGTAAYVIANGERRYRASVLAGRKHLEVIHREDVAKSRAAFLDAVQSENNDRKDLDAIERAIAIDTMVTELGGAGPVAVYYEKTKGWVSQQRKLLKLTPELQQLVSADVMPVRVARDIAGLPAEEQAAAWQQELEQRAQPKPRPQAKEVTPEPTVAEAPVAERFTAVNEPAVVPAPAVSAAEAPVAELEPEPELFTAVNESLPPEAPRPPAPATAPMGESVPEQRAEQEQEEKPGDAEGARKVPVRWDEPGYLANLIRTRMEDPHFFTMLGFLLTQASDRDSEQLQAVIEAHVTSA
ncbi:ParB N-terminal domain-containing protein [Streptomyces sp. NPDC056982]|uniref:ParB/RepB/Spo0J family partition protein n=1 Tax=Streptomyces sp. NPDC056982 TaxID=3345986 RepID=UPI00363DB8B4